MVPNPDCLLSHLREHGYHPRSAKHSDCVSECIVSDLIANCPEMRRQAAERRLVYDLNFCIFTGTADWNVDLVLGRPSPSTGEPMQPGQIIRAKPSTVLVAIEHKAVMTEHRKAIKNRKRDFEAHHDHVHRYNSKAIAAGVLLVNIAQYFRSPLRPEVTEHRNPQALVDYCVGQIRAVSQRNDISSTGLDAKAVIVLSMDNQDFASTNFWQKPPAPQVGDPLHYDAFIQRLCDRFTDRFA
jgi:hypothetical protein